MDLDRFHPTRRAMIRGLLLASGFAPAMLAALRRAGASGRVPIIPGVQHLQGGVRINAQPAKIGQWVQPGDRVQTDADGSCVIIIGAHVYLIRESSEVEFFAEDFAVDEAGAVSGIITLLSGAMLSVFGPTRTDIVTPLATIGIRGTACYVTSTPERTYVCLCYGHGELGGAEDGKLLETIKTVHHESPRYIYPQDAKTRIEAAPVMNHTDAELRMLEALVDRTPLFDQGGGDPGNRY